MSRSTTGRSRTSSAAPAPRTRCARTSRPSAAGGSCRACCATSPCATSPLELLGTRMPAPVMLAPIGVQTIVHEDGELASARAAAAVGLPLIASTASATTLEEIAEANGDGPRWYPALLAERRRDRRQLRPARRGRRLRRDRRHGRQLHPRLEAARPPAGLAARSSRASGIAQLLLRPGLPSRAREDAGGGHGRGHRPLPRRLRQPVADLGATSDWLREHDLAADRRSRASCTPTTPARRASAASTGSSSPTTAAGRSTARSPRSTRCRRSSTRSATR